MTKQLELWQGAFGDHYQDRNRFTEEEVGKRETFFTGIFQLMYGNSGALPTSVLEIGAGQGQNLAALERLSKKIQKPISLSCTEVNLKARTLLLENVKTATVLDDIPKNPTCDLVYTYGVLIHTHPAHLRGLLEKIYNASNRWIMCAEYFSPTTRMIPYRGETEALWADDFGSHYINNFKLRLIGNGFCWKLTTGLDNITFFLFEKVEKMN